jgi:transglutaminase-like putative cysteine protease
MKSRRNRRSPIKLKPYFIFLILLSLCLALTALLYSILGARGPLFVPIIFTSLAQIHLYIFHSFPFYQKPGTIAGPIIFGIGGILLLSQIVLIPYSAYIIWGSLAVVGEAQGSVSFIFVAAFAYFSGLFCFDCYSSGITKPFSRITVVLLFLFFIIYRQKYLLYLLLTATGSLLTVFIVSNVRLLPKYKIFIRFTSIVLFSVLIAYPLSLATTAKGSRFIDNRVSPGLRRAVVSVFPNFPVMFNIPGYGLGMPAKELGLPPILSQSPIFSISGSNGGSLYLRTAIYDRFDGTSWHSNLDTDITDMEKSDTFGTNKDSDHFQITFLTDFYKLLPHTLETYGFYSENYSEIAKGNYHTGFSMRTPFINGDHVTLFLDNSTYHVPDELTSKETTAYLSIPASLSSNIAQTAKSIAEKDPRDTIRGIADFLSEQYSYNLDTSPPGKNNFLDHFLFETREGYCVHFATAMIVLLRLQGIPARYATGFLVSAPYFDQSPIHIGNLEEKILVTGLSAHAWPEIWLPETGWFAYEATPPMRPEYYNDPDFWEKLIRGSNSDTYRQLRAIIGNSFDLLPSSKVTDNRVTGWKIILLISFILPIGILLIYLVRRQRDNRPAGSIEIVRLANGALKTSMRRGIKPPDKTGWLDWERQVSQLIGPTETGLNLFRKVFFAGYIPTASEKKMLRIACRSLRINTRQKVTDR